MVIFRFDNNVVQQWNVRHCILALLPVTCIYAPCIHWSSAPVSVLLFSVSKYSYIYPRCSKLSRKLLKNELKASAFRFDFERLPREAVFETDKTERCFFHFQTHLRTCRVQELEFFNPVYREQEHCCCRTKLDGTQLLPHVRCCQGLQGAQEISPYGNSCVESVSLNTHYVHYVYLTIHEVWAH